MPREYPYDLEAERSLLGAMLISKPTVNSILVQVEPDDFYDDRHRIIVNAMKVLHESKNPIDIVSLSSALSDMQQLDAVGGIEYLVQLSDSVPTVAHSDYYLEILQNKSTLRRLIKETTAIAEGSYGEVDNIEDFISDAERKILAVTQNRHAGEFKNIKDVVEEISRDLSVLAKSDNHISGIATGFTDFDSMTNGLHAGDLVILAARPAMGKTAFALNIAHNVAFNSKDPVALFSLEMPADQLVKRIISSMGNIDGGELKTGEILNKSQQKYYAATDRVRRCNLFIDDTPGLRASEIIAKARKLKNEKGLKLIIVDYLQLISGPMNSKDSRQQEVSNISRQMKALARELEVPVIALSQLSRSVEQRNDKRPMLSDLRESGAIEQDADIVMFLYRDDYYEKDSTKVQDQGITELRIAKHRNGSTGEVKLIFEKNLSRFSNYSNKDNSAASRDLR